MSPQASPPFVDVAGSAALIVVAAAAAAIRSSVDAIVKCDRYGDEENTKFKEENSHQSSY